MGIKENITLYLVKYEKSIHKFEKAEEKELEMRTEKVK